MRSMNLIPAMVVGVLFILAIATNYLKPIAVLASAPIIFIHDI